VSTPGAIFRVRDGEDIELVAAPHESRLNDRRWPRPWSECTSPRSWVRTIWDAHEPLVSYGRKVYRKFLSVCTPLSNAAAPAFAPSSRLALRNRRERLPRLPKRRWRGRESRNRRRPMAASATPNTPSSPKVAVSHRCLSPGLHRLDVRYALVTDLHGIGCGAKGASHISR
jgi:hypothetical protein